MSDHNGHQASPARGGRRGRGRGGARTMAARAGVKKLTHGRRGRQKMYEQSRAQAAHERQRDLKSAFTNVANAIRPALEELADRNLDLLRDQMNAHEEVEEYRAIKQFLDQRVKDEMAEADVVRDADIALMNSEFKIQEEYLQKSFKDRYDDFTEDFYDAQLLRLDILENLYNSREPVSKIDDSYDYREVTAERLANNGPYSLVRDGLEIPYPHLVEAEELKKTKSTRTPSKRKAGDAPDGQPTPKRAANTLNGASTGNIPRHIGGLLSAVAPPEEPGSPASKLPSPSPAGADAQTPEELVEPAEVTDLPAAQDEMLPPLPNGAGEPDEFGVRLVTKRARTGDVPNNRIMVPQPFEFEAHEIGFRDSTNDKTRGATKAKRGKFLNQPNSGTVHFDRTLWTYDATQNTDDDLDQELVQKHKLHPKYGVFIQGSINDKEPSKPFISGQSPVVYVGPAGEILHASHSVRASRADTVANRLCLGSLARDFAEEDGIESDEIQGPEVDKLAQERREAADERRRELEREEDDALEVQNQEITRDTFQVLLEASTTVEERAKENKPVTQRRSTVSRPYDAIRDVFGTSEPVRSASPPQDTFNLNFLADAALGTPAQLPDPSQAQVPEHVAMPQTGLAHPQMLQATEQMMAPAPQHYFRAEAIPAQEHLESAPIHREMMPMQTSVPGQEYAAMPIQGSVLGERPGLPSAPDYQTVDPRLAPLQAHPTSDEHATHPPPNAFFQTALNAPQHYAQSIAPHAAQYMPLPPTGGPYSGPPLAPAPPSRGPPPPHMSPGRNPFGNADNADGLPPLRPLGRSGLAHPGAPAGPLPAPSGPPPSGMPPSNSPYFGSPYLPAHDLQYQNGYPVSEHGSGPLDPALSQQPPPPSQGPYQHSAPMLSGYPMSPTFQGHGHPSSGALLQSPPPPQPLSAHGSTTPPRRVSGGMSANAKYRKLEPAPTPPHRMGWNSGSSELRTVNYEPKESIKDYMASAPTPSHGPTQIRGWNHTANRLARQHQQQAQEEPK